MDLVYAVNTHVEEANVLFTTSEAAQDLARIWTSLTTSTTWGEFRQSMPRAYWPEFADDRDGYPDDAGFSKSQMPGFDDGYYPGEWPAESMAAWFPDDLIERFDGWTEMTPNGIKLHLPASAVVEIVAELRLRGHNVEESVDDLPTFLRCAYTGRP